MSKSIFFFATKADLEPLFSAVETERPLKYVKAGMFDTPAPMTVLSALEIPNLAIAPVGEYIIGPCWLVLDPFSDVEVRAIPQQRGGIRYAIDQLINPQSVTIRPGGVFENSAVISGEVATCTNEPFSLDLMKLFARHIRRRFTRVRGNWVGKDAERLWNAGYRLTTSVKRPKEYDLAREL